MIVSANGIDLCVETFGDQARPAILLIGGAAASMDWWEEEFCQKLADGDGGRYVIRYDTRDTGQSTSFPAGAPPYSQADLTADALGVLDGLGLPAAHIAGVSMGGGIAQRIAIEHPERVLTLTLMSTSPGGPGGPSNPDLPPMADRLAAQFEQPAPQPDWSDREAVADQFVAGEKSFAGSIPVDEQRIRDLAGRVFDRTRDMAASQTNHWMIEGGEPVRGRLGEIAVPTLVLHGTKDPLFPIGHGEALAREIKDAHLVPIEEMGHQMPPPQVWDVVVPAIVQHTAREV
jgi:pimeloyl-ACP methyl ester carboxylesterase